MFVDARSVAPETRFQSDVCLIGAGAAGITLALALARAGRDVCLIESGGFELEDETQELHAGDVIGDAYPPLTSSRLRYLGGTTNHWGGACVPLEPFEFEAHDWVPHSGWPLTYADLAADYDLARSVLDLPTPGYRFDPAALGVADEAAMLGTAPTTFRTAIWRRTQPGPLRMGARYEPALRTAPRIRCVHHANVTELVTNEAGDRVVGVDVATLSGRRLRFEAANVVLCAGAIENARLLLLSDARSPGGIGNRHDLVGRFFADHGGQSLGVARMLSSDSRIQEEEFFRANQHLGGDVVGFVATPEFRRAQRTLGFAAMAFSFAQPDPRDSDALTGIRALIQRLFDSDPSDAAAAGRAGINFIYVAEKAPNPASRVFLTSDKDALGLRRVAVELDLLEEDRRSIEASRRGFGAAIARGGLARLRLEPYDPALWTGLAGHQSGTTRMAVDAKNGVTDRDGLVFGTSNLFVAGSSLFPTIGWENPTLTIVALALRLSRRLLDGASTARG